jgi:hypothetical protein
MLETDKQRRWWFANHPEYSSTQTGHTQGSRTREDNQGDKVSPHEVDEYVDYALKHVDGPLAVFLQSIKRNFGTEGNRQETYDESDPAEWMMAAGPSARGGFAGARRNRRRRRGRRDLGEIRDWFIITRHHREQMDIIEAELARAGANPRDYVFTSYKGRPVAQRNSNFDPHQRDPLGRTNIERMRDGQCPLDREGNEIVLHHANQNNEGPMIELTTAEHLSIPVRRSPTQINRQESNSFRQDYWRARAESFQTQ